jgi:uncharacterized repeat protein (TIGR04138 family)
MKISLEEIAKQDSRYDHAAYKFVYDGLGYTIKNIVGEQRHVTGQLLCEGLRQLAIERYGRLAVLVLDTWGVKTTRDFGEIVYTLIKNEWMSAQPTDTINDFDNIFDFKTALKDQVDF